jgi:hypothetical protein
MRRVAPMLLALGLAAGCASAPRSRRFVPPAFRSTGHGDPQRVPKTPRDGLRSAEPSSVHAIAHHAPPANSPAGLVERSLHQRGLRFGTDGSVVAVYTYLANGHRRVSPAKARPGDVLAFEIDEGCGDHLALVEEVAPAGRITFREWRDGQLRRSYADPRAPRTRRDDQGRVLNTFLRIKRPDDPAHARYFAGEMLCAVFRADKE